MSLFDKRRAALMERLGNDAICVIHSPPEAVRNGDSDFPFRQSSDIYYLTGFAEPDTTLILRPGREEPFIMFVRPRDKEREVWDGRRAGVEGARAVYGADAAFATSELSDKLTELIANAGELHYELGVDVAFDQRITRAIASLRRQEKRGRRPPRAVVDPREVLHEMRLRKSDEEVALLRRAAEITGEAHRAAMQLAAPGVGEWELEAIVDYTFRRRGGMGPGYTTIVGSGDNATILHYHENDRALAEGDLVLIDAGCELELYTADVTRTFPASGQFSEPQRRCYEIVLRAQTEAIAMTRPGVTIDDIHQHCVTVLTEGMVELGLLPAPAADRIEDGSYKRFYMHGTSHWLGMDVHDVGAYTQRGRTRPLEPGMVITIEPGLYIATDAEDVPDAYRGIGIRIEDDILVTASGADNLTAAIPKTIDEVEAACQTHQPQTAAPPQHLTP